MTKMLLWNQTVEVIRESMFAYAQLCGGNLACGIMAVTFLARLALLPLTLRLAKSAAVHQEAMRRAAPALEAARARFKNDPAALMQETRRVLASEGVSMFPAAGFAGAVLQTPVWLALFDAVRQCAAVGGRFLWIRSIAMPDLPLAVLVAAITAGSVAIGFQADVPMQQRQLLLAIPAILTVVALAQMAAGVGLYWGVSSAVAVTQGAIIRGTRARRTV